MRKKIFFVIASLGGGGSERVFWLLSQGFNKNIFDVYVVFLDEEDICFSTDLEGITFINLGTKKASKSFFKLLKLIKKENPFGVFSTTDHINILVSFISVFVKIPFLIARVSNNPHQMKQFEGLKYKFWKLFAWLSYKNYDRIVCQTEEMQKSVSLAYNLKRNRSIVIPNPVLHTALIKQANQTPAKKKLLIVARMTKEKGYNRLLDIFSALPTNYELTIAGNGPLKNEIENQIATLNLRERVTLLGNINDVISIIPKHDVLVLSSFTEGFPNVVLEALSVGVPVVTFRVGGVSSLIEDGFNGYVLEQNDIIGFKNKVITACNKYWDADAIKANVYSNYALDKVAQQYECLLK